MNEGYIQIQCTFDCLQEARRIINTLLKKKLIACASILPLVESLYTYKGQMEQVREHKILMKTHSRFYKEIEKTIEKLHSYDVPELLVFEVLKGSPSYTKWMSSVLAN